MENELKPHHRECHGLEALTLNNSNVLNRGTSWGTANGIAQLDASTKPRSILVQWANKDAGEVIFFLCLVPGSAFILTSFLNRFLI